MRQGKQSSASGAQLEGLKITSVVTKGYQSVSWRCHSSGLSKDFEVIICSKETSHRGIKCPLSLAWKQGTS